jgi:hypothetical protein
MKNDVKGGRKLTPSKRREQVALGVKSGQLRQLIARELGVTVATIGRDLMILGIKGNKKPAKIPAVKVMSPKTPPVRSVGKPRRHWRARWLAANPPRDENLQHEELREYVLLQGRIRVRLI